MGDALIVGHDNRYTDGTPVATETVDDLDFSVLHVNDLRKYTRWKAGFAGTKYISVDAGTSKAAEYLAIRGHNLGTAAALVSLEKQVAPGAWTHRTKAGAFVGDFRSVAYGNGKFVAVGVSGEIQTSTDGITWAQQTPAASYSGDFYAITFGDGKFVATGDTGEIQTSADGITWAHETSASAGNMRGVGYGDNLYIIVGQTGIIQTSPDGSAWTLRTADDSYTGQFESAAYGNGVYVIVGASAEIQTSADGITWAHQDPAGSYAGGWIGIAFCGDARFVVVGTVGEIQASTDGETWEEKTPASASTFTEIAYGDGIHKAVGTGGHIETSLDADTWEQQTPGGGFVGNFYGIAFGNGTFVAVGASAEIQSLAIGWVEVLAPFTPDSDGIILRGFTQTSARYWRVKIVTASILAELGILIVGDKLQLPYSPDAPIALYDEGIKAKTQDDDSDELLGTTIIHRDRKLSFNISTIERAFVFGALKDFWDNHSRDRRPFIIAPFPDDFPEAIWWMRNSASYRWRTPLRFFEWVESARFDLVGPIEDPPAEDVP